VLLGDFGGDSAERLKIFASTEDGFAIARADMEIRGYGNLFGEEQSGDEGYRIADPIRDEQLNIRAQEIAEKMLDADPELQKKEHAGIRDVLSKRYSRALKLFRVG
jgi:ATP-dependent DNA helicase RecG